MDNLKVAAVCMNVKSRRVEENLDRIHSFVLEASGEGADIICFPELCLTGYSLRNPRDNYDHGPDSDQAIADLVRMSKETRLTILAGLTENSGQGHPFISHVIAGPDGLIGIYRKTHLSPHERKIYRAGEKIELYPYKKTLFGIQLCYEAHFPEISTVMAIMGADIIFLPHASPRGDADGKLNSWLRHLTARAFDNGVFVVACNQVGDTEEGLSFPGAAVVLGPDGQVLAKQAGDKEAILYSSLEARMIEDIRKHRMKYFIPRRRPELYGKIIQQGKSQ